MTHSVLSVLRFAAISAASLVGIGSPSFAADGPLRMFIDDQQIAASQGISRVLERPTKLEKPVLVGNDTWDRNPYLFGTVIYDSEERLFKMWYMSYNYGDPIADRTPVLYATSTDGRAWERPELGLIEFRGSRQNNIVLMNLGFGDLYSPSVIKDSKATDPSRRYKMIVWDKNDKDSYKGGGMFIAFSPDGKRWTRHADKPVLYTTKNEQALSDVMDVMQDPATGKYVAYAKGWADPFPLYRQVVRTESSDFENWSVPAPVVKHHFDEIDPQSYGMPVFAYEGLYLGLLRSYKKPGNETLDIQLTVSHDNLNWSRVANEATFIPVGPEGAWDDGMVYTAPPIVHGNDILIYYGGWDGPHNLKKRTAAIGLATLPVGRFVGIKAARGDAKLTTKPFPLQGKSIAINVNAGKGTLRAAVVDSQGIAIPGFGFENAEALKVDELAKSLVWNGTSDLSALAGKTVQLQFELTGDAKLYGFREINVPDAGK